MSLFFIGLAIGLWLGLIFNLIIETITILKKAAELKLETEEDYIEEDDEPFTYDCLNDPDPDDTDIPKLY
jgi:hypothetical protein